MAKARRILLFVAVAALLSFSSALAADTLTLRVTSLPSERAGGNYVGFMEGTVNGVASDVGFLCIDYFSSIRTGRNYTVNVSTFDDLANVKLRDDDGNPLVNRYKRAAWLMYQMVAHPEATAAIQYAIWNIMTFGDADDYSGQRYWMNLSNEAKENGFWGFDFSHVRIYSPTNTCSTCQQELMTFAPIPPAVWLLGSGLLGLIGIRRRRQKE